MGRHQGDEMAGVLPTRRRCKPAHDARFTTEVKPNTVQEATGGNQRQEPHSRHHRRGDEGQEEECTLEANVVPLIAAKSPGKGQSEQNRESG